MPLITVLSGMGLGVVAHGDALRARKRAQDDIDLVLLDELARHSRRGGRSRVGGGNDRFDLHATGLAAGLFERQFDVAHAVRSARRKGSLKGNQNADLDRVLRDRFAGHINAKAAAAPMSRFMLNPPKDR
jgi:hypothetical protein